MKTNLLKAFFCAALLLPSLALFAQDAPHCGTDAHHAALLNANPALQAREETLERQYREFIQNRPATQSRSTFTIPVVVHVIQYSAFETISDARIISQIDVLNEDFQLLNADTTDIPAEFKPFAADTEIEFCLASIDPTGCPTDGIVRVVAPDYADHAIGQSAQMKALSQWDPSRYLNIWVPVSIADNILGYATFPGTLQNNPGEDGVVINGYYMGRGNGISTSSFDLGRTGTHEVGHWLGLFHTFQGGCSGTSPTNCDSQGDRVCDTPPTANPNYGCPSTRNSCTETPVDQNDMMVNYMDYGDDRCLLMFSAGQKDRMAFFLNGARSNIWSAANLTSTGCDGTQAPGCYPVADFSAQPISICAGDTIQLTDLSTGPPATYGWGLAGGSPVSSSLPNPTVSYATPGIYTVSLAVSNAFGFDVKTMDIEVVAPVAPPQSEGFEAASLPGGWYVVDEDQAGTWESTSVAASEGQSCMVTRNYIHRQKGTRDELVGPLYDLSSIAGPKLVFDYAYKRRDAFSPDTLNIFVTTDCGRSWEKVWSKGGFALATAPGLSIPVEFVPDSSQWKTDTIDLAPWQGLAGLRVKFQCIGRYGQSLYLDRINLDGIITGQAGDQQNQAEVRVYPNPFAEAPRIEVDLEKGGRLEWTVSDINGRTLMRQDKIFSASKRQMLQFEAGFWGKLPSGVYIISIVGTDTRLSQKLIKM